MPVANIYVLASFLAISCSCPIVLGWQQPEPTEPVQRTLAAPAQPSSTTVQPDLNAAEVAASAVSTQEAAFQSRLLSDIRQVTLSGRRAGEGYFSKDGKQMVFQSEREPGNPFYQIYLMDRQLGDIHRLSPGVGKTTCAWIHPNGNRVLFASTQYDPEALAKQDAELELRASGQQRKYSWDYDPQYELVEFRLDTHEYVRLTNQIGYDAEASYSPDGQQICFASNRRAYSQQLSAEEQQLFDHDPASAMDLYIMNTDGSNLRRLTDTIGYDGGPFFSPDGTKICWRRFSRNGATAEIMVMNVDGSDQRAITSLGAMSWAPYFHPSGEYLIFTTNLHGFNNFELYMIDVQAKSQPVRVTYRENFDGLPVFTPDGNSLVWTSNGQSSSSQIYEAAWNHQQARALLGLEPSSDDLSSAQAARQTAASADADITPIDIGRHVDYLCRPELGGRLTGTVGEQNATAYVAAYLDHLGLKPAGPDGSYFQPFEFVSDVRLGSDNQLILGQQQYELDRQWRPLSFSQLGEIPPSHLVFAGYGIVAPEAVGQPMYDSYVHLDVEDKWVVIFRRMPQNISPERRQYLSGFSHDRFKAMVARERGARGVIFVSGPTSQFKSPLIPLRLDGSLGTSSLAVISVTDEVVAPWFLGSGESLQSLQAELDSGELMMGFPLECGQLSAKIDVDPVTSRGRNVLAMLPAKVNPSKQMIVVGAHIDHLGTGTGSSLAKENEQGSMHLGADDNASGVACILEMAQSLVDQQRQGKFEPRRDILFAAWSGEELGLRGSAAFVNDFQSLYPDRLAEAMADLEDAAKGAESVAEPDHSKLYPSVAACLNLDMVGRLRENLILQGLGSSPYWTEVIERRNAVVRIPLTLQQDCHLPTDATSFFLKGVPILSAFTGSHDEYHTPRDLPQLLNYDGAAQVAKLMTLIARDLALADRTPEYREQTAQPEMRANLTAYLGTVPDYGQSDLKGVKLSGVTKDAPADKAGLRGGDTITELAGRKIENVYDYTYAIEALKIGETVSIKVQRGEKQIELEITPTSRQ